MRRILGSVVAILGLTAFAAPAAHADVFAAVCVGAGGQDIAVLNAATGVRRALPAGVNTSAAERNPSISSDGRRLVFQRLVPNGTPRLIAMDLSTGQSADLFDGFETAADPINFSTITPNGATVATGRSLRSVLGRFVPRVTLTSLVSFPSGPFTRSALGTSRRYLSGGDVESVGAAGGNLFAVHVRPQPANRGEIFLAQLGGSSSTAVRSANIDYSRPALAASNPDQVLFVERIFSGGVGSFGDIVFRPATLSGFPGTPTKLLSGVSTADEETLPALTSDGRYVGFVRGFNDVNRPDRFFVWDSLTRIFLNPNGVSLGAGAHSSHFGCGSMSIYLESILTSGVITNTGNVNATLQLASSIGIFVQRIVGKTTVLGRKAYELETVGRVPLGSYGEGNVFTHWDFAVDGVPLPPGRYLVTLRAVEATAEGTVVRELGEPQVLKVDKHGRAHMLRAHLQ